MKEYRGIVRIECTRKAGCPQGLRNVQATCMACSEAVTRIVDLEGKILHESRALEAILETAPRDEQVNKKRAGKKQK